MCIILVVCFLFLAGLVDIGLGGWRCWFGGHR